MADRALVSSELIVEAFDDHALSLLLNWISRPGAGQRWVIGRQGSVWRAVWPQDGATVTVDDPERFCRERGDIGFALPGDSLQAFCRRFKDASDITALMRVAGAVAPVLPNLHAEVYGLNGYDLRPAAKSQTLINLFGRFLPKHRAIAIVTEVDGVKSGLYAGFNGRREIERVVGMAAWPRHVVEGGPLKDLQVLGLPVEIGIRITADAFRGLFEDKLNRAGYAKLFKRRDIVLDPLPLAPKLALKAARIV